MTYRVVIQADTRSGGNVDAVAAHLGRRLAELVGDAPATTAKRPRGGRVGWQLELDLELDAARAIPRAVRDAVEADGYLNGENGGEIRYLAASVFRDGGTVAFSRSDLRP